MYNGFGNYRMGGAGGGQNSMMVMMCCVLCVCVLCCAIGYFTNMFCGMSKSLGRSCGQSDTPMPQYDPVEAPSDPAADSPTSALQTCAKAISPTTRLANDPRPEVHPSSCKGVERMQGRDCFYWKVDEDPLTKLARWVRVTNGDADMYNPACSPKVKCDTKINFDNPEMGSYREADVAPLIKWGNCKAVTATATNRDATLTQFDNAAKALTVSTTGYGNWTSVKSRILYDRISGFIGQNDMMIAINNVKKAANHLKKSEMFSDQSVPMDAYAYMIEAASRTYVEDAAWIYNMAVLMNQDVHKNLWSKLTLRGRWLYWMKFLRSAVPLKDRRGAMQDWTVLTQSTTVNAKAPEP